MTTYNILKGGGRFYWIDYVKTFAIFLVLLGHSPLYHGEIRTVLYSFHMPLFFTVSGFLYKERPLRTEIRKISNSLYLPYLLYMIFLYPYAVLKHGDIISFKRILQVLSGCLENTSAVYSSLWFIFALITIRLMISATQKLNDIIKLIISIALYSIIYYNNWCLKYDFFQFDTALLGISFFIIGKIIREYNMFIKLSKQKTTYLINVVLLILVLIFSLKNGDVDTFKNITGHSLIIFYFNAIFFSYLIMFVAYKFCTRKNSFIETISSGTLFILGFHKFIIGKADAFGCENIIFIVFFTVVATSVFYFPIKILLRYCPIMLGKTKHKKDIGKNL